MQLNNGDILEFGTLAKNRLVLGQLATLMKIQQTPHEIWVVTCGCPDQNRSTVDALTGKLWARAATCPPWNSAPGISKDDQDLIRPGRITMKPTIEQNALVKACKPGTPLLLEDGIMEVRTMAIEFT